MSGSDIHPERAYRDPEFMNSPEARSLRILAEYLEPQERFEDFNIKDTILFFGSARLLPRDEAARRLEAAEAGGGDLIRAKADLRMSRYYEDTRELAHRLTDWSKSLKDPGRRFVICSGGGPGIMEAANRGASEAKGDNIGLGISLPMEQGVNPYVTRKLAFEFHYFFTRKFWFLYLAKAMVIMPGGFGTLDELFEGLTLIQTGKMKKKMPIILYGSEFWDKVLNLEALVEFGTISRKDLDLFQVIDTVDEAFDIITRQLGEFAIDNPGPGL
tara:strand:+ start:1821 stop:2636 length:816 start_codon:yes stop_codon:yes gene_type:complete